MKIFSFLSKKREKATLITPEKYYLDLDEISLWRWEKLLEGKLNYLRRDEVATELDPIAWVQVYNAYLKRFPMEKKMEEYLDVKIYVTELMALYIISRDRMIMNQIEIEQQKLISLDPSKHEGLNH